MLFDLLEIKIPWPHTCLYTCIPRQAHNESKMVELLYTYKRHLILFQNSRNLNYMYMPGQFFAKNHAHLKLTPLSLPAACLTIISGPLLEQLFPLGNVDYILSLNSI